MILCESEKRAKALWEDLSQLLPHMQVLWFPPLEMIPYEILAQSNEVESQRLQVLCELLEQPKDARIVVVTVMDALSKKLLPPSQLREGMLSLAVGTVIEPAELRKHLVQYGYEAVEQVSQAGQFAVRGGIFDIATPNYEQPIRLEFFDDEVDSIRVFDWDNQCSIEKLQQVVVMPAKEFCLTEVQRKEGLERIHADFIFYHYIVSFMNITLENFFV